MEALEHTCDDFEKRPSLFRLIDSLVARASVRTLHAKSDKRSQLSSSMAVTRLLPAGYDLISLLCLEDVRLTSPEMYKALLHSSTTLERLQLHRCHLSGRNLDNVWIAVMRTIQTMPKLFDLKLTCLDQSKYLATWASIARWRGSMQCFSANYTEIQWMTRADIELTLHSFLAAEHDAMGVIDPSPTSMWTT